MNLHQQKVKLHKYFVSTACRGILACFVIVFGVMYVIQTSAISTTGYDMRDLEKKITELERENQRVEYDIAKYRSMESIQARLAGMNMVPAGDVQYVALVGTSVARR